MQNELLKDSRLHPCQQDSRDQALGEIGITTEHMFLLAFPPEHLLWSKWRKQELSAFTGDRVRVPAPRQQHWRSWESGETEATRSEPGPVLCPPWGDCQFLPCVRSVSKQPRRECCLRGHKVEQSCQETQGAREKGGALEGEPWEVGLQARGY